MTENQIISVLDFGARVTKNNDDTEAFKKALTFANTSSVPVEILIPKGHYKITNTVFKGVLNVSMKITGEIGTIIECSSIFINCYSPKQVIELGNYTLKRGHKNLDIKGLNPVKNDILSFYSNKIAEKAWKYKKSEIHIISNIKNYNISLKDKINFPFDKTEKLKFIHYEAKSFAFDNLTLIHTSTKKEPMILLHGVRPSFNKLFLDNINAKNNFVNLVDCVDIDLVDIQLQNNTYGFLFANCRNVKSFNLISHNTVHPLVPALWSTNLTFDKIRGTNTAIDAHPSFNVNYNDVIIDTGKGYFNCRSLGVKISNSKFSANPEYRGNSVYVGISDLSEELSFLQLEYDIEIDNVEWLHFTTKWNGLTARKANSVKFKNCTTHQIHISRGSNSVEVDSCRIGQFHINDGNFSINNSIFDGNLIQGSKDYVLSFSWTGEGYLQNCEVKNYNVKKTYLFNYLNHPTLSKIKLVDTKIADLKGLVKESRSRSIYEGISIINCDIKNLNDPIQNQFINHKSTVVKTKFRNIPNYLELQRINRNNK